MFQAKIQHKCQYRVEWLLLLWGIVCSWGACIGRIRACFGRYFSSRLVRYDLGLIGCAIVAIKPQRHLEIWSRLVFQAEQGKTNVLRCPEFGDIALLPMQALIVRGKLGFRVDIYELVFFHDALAIKHQHIDDVRKHIVVLFQPPCRLVFRTHTCSPRQIQPHTSAKYSVKTALKRA